jgi:hypothetical protein
MYSMSTGPYYNTLGSHILVTRVSNAVGSSCYADTLKQTLRRSV